MIMVQQEDSEAVKEGLAVISDIDEGLCNEDSVPQRLMALAEGFDKTGDADQAAAYLEKAEK